MHYRPSRKTSGYLMVALGLLAMTAAPAAQAKSTATVFPYTFVNPDGSRTVIPSEPKRVVLIGQPEQLLDTVVSLGVHPVGAEARDRMTTGVAPNGYPLWLDAGELSGITNVGSDEQDYETIAALKPDLIVSYEYGPSIIAQLQAIAPTVQVDSGSLATGPVTFPWEPTLLSLAPIFNATDRAQQIVARLRQRTSALSGFARGTTVGIFFPEAGYQDFVQVTGDQSLGSLFLLAGAKVEGPLEGGPDTPGQNILQSTELLSKITATKVVFPGVGGPNDTGVTEAATKALPLYPEIPAVQNGQAYFTPWWMTGPIGEADALSQLQKQMFGVTGLEAALAGAGPHRSRRSGIADIDVGGPTGRRVCWDVSTIGSVGHPTHAVVLNAKGQELFALGSRYSGKGCASVERASVRKLLAHPGRYVLSITARKTTVLRGDLGLQMPSFFGNGKDKLVTQH